MAETLAPYRDTDMLHTVLENLLDNAWKFTSKHLAAKLNSVRLKV